MITQKKNMTSETLHDTKIPKRDANCETDVKSKVIKETSGRETCINDNVKMILLTG